jgi:hypothetical protein
LVGLVQQAKLKLILASLGFWADNSVSLFYLVKLVLDKVPEVAYNKSSAVILPLVF